jgi:hypothetical protein
MSSQVPKSLQFRGPFGLLPSMAAMLVSRHGDAPP